MIAGIQSVGCCFSAASGSNSVLIDCKSRMVSAPVELARSKSLQGLGAHAFYYYLATLNIVALNKRYA